MATSLIIDVVIIFVAALIGGYIADRLRQSPVIGYILGGIIVGPHVLRLVHDQPLIGDLSELGVILLMFTLGIEFSLSRLEKVRKIAIAGGFMQIAAIILIGLLAGYLLGYSLYHSLFLGCVLSISSTMIVLRSLSDRGELSSLHSQVMLGILIVQDLAVIIMVSLLPTLQDVSMQTIPAILLSLGKAVAFVLVMVFLAQRVVPHIMDRAARSSSSDIFLILALAMGVGIAAIAHSIGLSLSLGAFLAGMVISESDYAHEIMGKIVSLRDTFVVLFFVAVGMMVEPSSLFDNWVLLLVLLVIIIPVKMIVIFAITRLFGYHSKVAFYVGVGLVQTGEFSIVLANLGLSENLIPPEMYNAILGSALITILLSPSFIKAAPYWYHRLRQYQTLKFLVPEPEDVEVNDEVLHLKDHTILCGYGRIGVRVGLALQQLQVPLLVIDYDFHAINHLIEKDITYIYGDASNEIVIEHAHPETAKMAVVVLPDVFSNQMAVRNLRKANPDLIILVRAHSEWEKEVLLKEGANDVIQPEMEAGLQVVREVITHMEIPEDVVEEYLESLYIRQYNRIIEQQGFERIPSQSLKVREFVVKEDAPWAGKHLYESQVRDLTGANIVTLRKADGKVIISPTSDEKLEVGDSVIVMGTGAQLRQFAAINENGDKIVVLPQPASTSPDKSVS